MELGKRLRLLREQKKLSQIQLADKLGIPHQSISNYERGYRHPPSDTLLQIADFFEVSVDYLLGRSAFIYKQDGPKEINEFLKEGIFTWDGVALTQKELEHLKETLDWMVKYRIDLLKSKNGD